MKFELLSRIEHILILGAGASVSYGLPTWKDLCPLMRAKITKDSEGVYSHREEILEWIDKVGEGRAYDTLDRCIEVESASAKYHLNGHVIENQIFLLIRDIFVERYKQPDGSWIRGLNENMRLHQDEHLEHKIAFINYNYDDVLERNFLDFTYLPAKKRIFNSKERLEELQGVLAPGLYPHGSLFLEEEKDRPMRVYKYLKTMKTGNPDYFNAVSCYESERHSVERAYGKAAAKLYILGLGGGLQVNLGNVDWKIPISEIHVTIKDTKTQNSIIKFLSEKYAFPEGEIKIYPSCEELINSCFPS